MPAWIAVLETRGGQRVIDSVLWLIEIQRGAGETDERERVVRIDLQGGVAGLLAVFPAMQLE